MAIRETEQTKLLIALTVVLGLGVLAGYGVRAWQLEQEFATPAGQLKLAERAYQTGDNQIAFNLFEGLAKKGDPNAEYWLAHMKDFGVATPQDVVGAIPLYIKAADRGNVAAAARLGEIYLDGFKTPQDFTRAKRYLEQAARRGNVHAATELGRMYATGLGVAKDAKMAYAWYEAAVVQGSLIARHERDQLIAVMPQAEQQQALTEAENILKEIKSASAPSPAATLGAPKAPKSK